MEGDLSQIDFVENLAVGTAIGFAFQSSAAMGAIHSGS
jgi:hypothetical protein